jgi:UrcA family protein
LAEQRLLTHIAAKLSHYRVRANFSLENFMRTFPTTVLLTAILAAMSHASSADEQGGVAVRVRYDDLNLSAPAGVASLRRRVSRAAAQVCDDGGDKVRNTLRQSCMRGATDNAFAQVKWPSQQGKCEGAASSAK